MQQVYTSATSSGVTVGATTTVVLTATSGRLFAVLVNDSDEAMYISIGTPAVMNKGIRLNATGGTLRISGDELTSGAINAICASGSKVLCVLEA